MPPKGAEGWRRWQSRLIALGLFVFSATLGLPSAALLLSRTLGSAIDVPSVLYLYGLGAGLGSAALIAAYWIVADNP